VQFHMCVKQRLESTHAKKVKNYWRVVIYIKMDILVTKRFKMSTNQLNWGAARAACKAKGMDLANPTTPEENLCLVDAIDMAGNF
jgi:hypothetical protein